MTNSTYHPQTTRIIEHIVSEYGLAPEYLWPEQSPTFCVFRHRDTKKWFALIMTVPGNRIGLDTSEITDIIDLKFDKGQALDFVEANRAKGILPAYHMNKSNWITAILDGTQPDANIFQLIDQSYKLAGGK